MSQVCSDAETRRRGGRRGERGARILLSALLWLRGRTPGASHGFHGASRPNIGCRAGGGRREHILTGFSASCSASPRLRVKPLPFGLRQSLAKPYLKEEV